LDLDLLFQACLINFLAGGYFTKPSIIYLVSKCFTEAKLRSNSGAQRLVGTTPIHPELGGEITERKKGPARGTLWNLFPSARVKKS
jgi:hypothetical protein